MPQEDTLLTETYQEQWSTFVAQDSGVAAQSGSYQPWELAPEYGSDFQSVMD